MKEKEGVPSIIFSTSRSQRPRREFITNLGSIIFVAKSLNQLENIRVLA